MPQVDPGDESDGCAGCGCFLLVCILGFVLICGLLAAAIPDYSDDWYTVEPTTTQGK